MVLWLNVSNKELFTLRKGKERRAKFNCINLPKDPMSFSSLSFSIFQPRFFWPISHNTLINCHCGQSCPIKRGSVQKRLFHVFSVFIQCGIVKRNVTMTGTSKLTPKLKSLISETFEKILQYSSWFAQWVRRVQKIKKYFWSYLPRKEL